MYYNEFKMIIEKILKGDFDKKLLGEYLIDTFDCEKIYDSDDIMVTDAFFSLKHYLSGEEDIRKEEWLYFLDCLSGKCEYSIERKMHIKTKPSACD